MSALPRLASEASSRNKRPRDDHDQIKVKRRPPKATKVVYFGDESGKQGNRKEARAKLSQRRQAILQARESLPVWKSRERILDVIGQNDCTIILGETGSGKTTLVPQFLQEAGYAKDGKVIGITQPRRVAAITLADRVALEMGTSLGGKVGYSIRFDDRTSRSTLIKYLTDGMLLRELLNDRLLEKYSVVITDEAHERTVRTDILMGYLKLLQAKRKEAGIPLKLVVMSATLEQAKFARFFNNAPIVRVEGRLFPVETFHLDNPVEDYIDATLRCIYHIHKADQEGDILVFLTGQEDIEKVERLLSKTPVDPSNKAGDLKVYPLYAALPQAQQNKAFEPVTRPKRKVVISTNIAETSITIPGIRFVIDCGLFKERSFDSNCGIDSLLIQAISKSSALQRTGRAGREAAGRCWRLYTKKTFDQLAINTVPEIARCDLSSVVLYIKAIGHEDVLHFPFMDMPDRDQLVMAHMSLLNLGALDQKGKITSLGKRMADFPLDPPFALVLIESERLGCTKEIIDVIALLEQDNLFVSSIDQREAGLEAKKPYVDRSGDHMTLLNTLRAFESVTEGDCVGWCHTHYLSIRALRTVLEVRKQLRAFCERGGIDWTTSCLDDGHHDGHSGIGHAHRGDAILQALAAGFSQNTAVLQSDLGGHVYRTLVGNTIIKIHPSSVLIGRKVPLILFSGMIMTTQLYVRGVSVVEAHWLKFAAQHGQTATSRIAAHVVDGKV